MKRFSSRNRKQNRTVLGEDGFLADPNDRDILGAVAQYYSSKLAEHGQSPRGVDWNSARTQLLRFAQLSKVIADSSDFSVNDLGCGYGSYFDYLRNNYDDIHYVGIDVSADMVAAARQRFANVDNGRFVVSVEPDTMADYGIASGIFNVRLNGTDDAWHAHILRTLDVLDKTCRRGFAFNCLTSYSDADKVRDYLYYANPAAMFDHCKRNYSRDVALLHDYGLYEFTILVRKS
ncbi:class I SAM-dependent methyltransferase [Rhizobium leguminosarum]|nr:class I SAM-dependent methyltransferase [Rhizobium leguminosarum]